MLFSPRHKPSFAERLRVAAWPRRNWRRSALYVFYRLRRLSGSPHAIALGCAAGVFIAFTPTLGMQFMLAALLAWLLGGNILASTLGTFAANPLSFPVIWVSTYKLGCVMLGAGMGGACALPPASDLSIWGHDLLESIMRRSLDALLLAVHGVWPVIKPMMLGSIPLGILAASLAYLGARKLIKTYQSRRRARFRLLPA